MVHILPEAYGNESVNSKLVSLVFISAICVFIIIERLFVKCGVSHKHCAGGDENGPEDAGKVEK